MFEDPPVLRPDPSPLAQDDKTRLPENLLEQVPYGPQTTPNPPQHQLQSPIRRPRSSRFFFAWLLPARNTIISVMSEGDPDGASPPHRRSEPSTCGTGGCSTDSHGDHYSRCTQAAGPAAGGIAVQALIFQELWSSEDAMQWRLMRTGNRISASYADQSNRCSAAAKEMV